MSRIGKLPVKIPSGVTVTQNKQEIILKGPKGELKLTIHPNIAVVINESEITFTRPNDQKENKALHGLSRALMNNAITGITKGFEKRLEVRGVGYRFTATGKGTTLQLGFSHPIEYKAPEGVEITADEENKNIMIIKGIDKQKVGETAAQIRGFKKPEPYKGKGIRYENEHVPQKAGKAAAKAA